MVAERLSKGAAVQLAVLPAVTGAVLVLILLRSLGWLPGLGMLDFAEFPFGVAGGRLQEATNLSSVLIVLCLAIGGLLVLHLVTEAASPSRPVEQQLLGFYGSITRSNHTMLALLLLLAMVLNVAMVLASEQNALPGVISAAALFAWLRAPIPPGSLSTPESYYRVEHLLDLVRAAPFYSGQVHSVVRMPAKPPRHENSKAVADDLASYWLGDTPLSHQARTLDALYAGEEGVVASLTPAGSGRHATMACAAAHSLVRRGLRTLLLVPRESDVEIEATRMRRAGNFEPRVERLMHVDSVGRLLGDGVTPDVLVCDIPTLERILEAEHETWSPFLASVGLVILVRAESFTSVVGTQTSWVFRRLRLKLASEGRTPALLAFGMPVADGIAHLRQLFGIEDIDDACVVREDGQERREVQLIFWSNTLEINHETEKTVRRPYRRDIADLLHQIVAAGYSPFILFDSAALTAEDITVFQEEWDMQLTGSPGLNTSVPIVSSIDDLDDAGEFDACICAGVPIPWSSLDFQVRHLGGSSLAPSIPVFVVGAERPIEQAAIRSAKFYMEDLGQPPPAISAVDVPSVRRTHLKKAISAMPVNVGMLMKHGWSSDDIGQVLAECEAEKFGEIAEDDQGHIILEDHIGPIRLAGDAHIALTAIHPDPVKLVDLTGNRKSPIDEFDESRMPEKAVPDLVRMTESGRFIVRSRLSESAFDFGAVPTTGGEAVVSFPLQLVEVEANKELTQRLRYQRVRRGDRYQFWTGSLDVSRCTTHLREYFDFDLQYPDQVRVKTVPDEERIQIHHPTQAAVFMMESTRDLSESALRALASTFRSALSALLGRDSSHVVVYPIFDSPMFDERPAIVIFEVFDEDMGLVRSIESQFPKLLEIAYAILCACPCRDGCSACVISPEDPLPFPETFGKIEALRTLSRLLDHEEEGAQLIRELEIAVEDRERLLNIARKLRDVLADRLTLTLEDPPPVRFMSDGDLQTMTGIIGFFDSGEHEIAVAPLPRGGLTREGGESRPSIVEVLAHEYAHAWCHEPGNFSERLSDPTKVYFNGLLFSEGFAQWTAFKILDFYGLRRHMDAISLWRYDEYGEGFKVFKWLEDEQGGVSAVLEFCRTGEYDGGLEQLYKDSETRDRILDLVRRYGDQVPQTDVITPEHEAESTDGASVSAVQGGDELEETTDRTAEEHDESADNGASAGSGLAETLNQDDDDDVDYSANGDALTNGDAPGDASDDGELTDVDLSDEDETNGEDGPSGSAGDAAHRTADSLDNP